jgi:O-succinylbenzoate synthase
MIEAVDLRLVRLPLVTPFRTSFGVDTAKECVLVRVLSGGIEGWGECVAGPDPGYSEEFNEGAWSVLRDHLVPRLVGREVLPEEIAGVLAGVRGNRMAKASLEMALLDAHARALGVSLRDYLGGARDEVPVGVSIGIADIVGELVATVERHVATGYRRIKLKIAPGTDVEPVAAVRASFPDIALSVDANAAYTPEDVGVFEALDAFGLLMIEQPLSHEDLVQHAALQRRIETPICLDESIRSADDARAALELGSCRIINIKQGRVGGLLEARLIHDVAVEAGIPVWCGGMLETGLGRAANLALAALPGFTLPGDISSSARYFKEDLTEPFEASPEGMMTVPGAPGLGVSPLPERIDTVTVRRETIGRR